MPAGRSCEPFTYAGKFQMVSVVERVPKVTLWDLIIFFPDSILRLKSVYSGNLLTEMARPFNHR